MFPAMKLLGMGKKKRRRKKGGSILDRAIAVNSVLRDKQAISAVLDAVGASGLASKAKKFGYGKKKRTTRKKKATPKKRRRRRQGGSFLGDILGTVVKPFAGGIMGATAGISQGLAGMGRKGGRYYARPGGFVPRQRLGVVMRH